jgi:hypothetical protein
LALVVKPSTRARTGRARTGAHFAWTHIAWTPGGPTRSTWSTWSM